MKSGEMTCIYSTLNYVHGLATRHHVHTIITFDQPLFWKASEIVQILPMGHQLLWHNLRLNYQYMLAVARTLVKADWTGSWDMHLGAISKCLPIFAAAGHFNYWNRPTFICQIWLSCGQPIQKCCTTNCLILGVTWVWLGNRTYTYANAEVGRTTNMLFQTHSC